MSHKRVVPIDFAADPESSAQTGKKPKREYTELDRKLADNFERLGDEIESERVGAAVEIVDLYQSHNTISEKIVVRLIKGLCSSRKAARPGFFIAFCEVLKATKDNPEILRRSVEDLSEDNVLQFILDSVKAFTQTDGGASTQEKRDYLLGRISAYNAILQCGILIGQVVRPSHLDSLLEGVWEVSQKSSQYSEQCGKVYYDAVIMAISNNDEEAIKRALRFLKEKNLFKTPEAVAIWLKVSQADCDVRLPKHIWHHKDPLSKKELPTLALVMKGAGLQEDSEDISNTAKNAGSRRDAPHFAWSILLEWYIRKIDLSEEEGRSKNFRRFWNTVVDDVYFAPTASPERKALGFRIFSLVLEEHPAWACEQALSRRLTQCLITQSQKNERVLNKAATALLEKLKSRAVSDRSLAVTFLSALIFKDIEGDEPKSPRANSEQISQKRGTINELFKDATEDVAEGIMTLLIQVLLRPGVETEQEVDAVRKAIADQLISLARQRKHVSSDKGTAGEQWKTHLLHALITCSCFDRNATSAFVVDGLLPPLEPQISKATQDTLRVRLLSYLRELLNTRASASISLLVSELRYLWRTQPGPQSFEELRDDKKATKATSQGLGAFQQIQKMEENGNEDAAHLRAFKLLFSMTILQILCGEKEAIAILDDLLNSYYNIANEKDTRKEDFDAIVQIILGYCSHSSAVYRSISEQMFEGLASEISRCGLQSMVFVLDQEENITGQRELFERSADDDSDHVGRPRKIRGKRSNAEDSDVEIVDAEVDGQSVESLEDSNLSSEDEGDTKSQDEALNEALGKILYTKKIDPEASDSAETESADDEPFDDDMMITLGVDEQLSAIFAQRQAQLDANGTSSSKKKEQKEARQNVVNFKTRVIDLLGIYVKQQHASESALSIILPLLRLMGRTRTVHLAKKASELLDVYFNTAKSKGMPLDAPTPYVWVLLRQVHQEVLVFPSKWHAGACSRASLFLARLLLLQKEEKAMSKMIRLYAGTHEERFETKSAAPASFWMDFASWSVQMGGEK